MVRERLPQLLIGETTGSASSSSSSPERAVYDECDFFTLQRNDSQSSIGISSVRDLNISPTSEREYRMSPISRLPSELLIHVFARLSSPADLRNCMLVSKTWSSHSVDLLWHRPLCNTWKNLGNVVSSLRKARHAFYPYFDLVRRLNLSNLSDQISDGTVLPFIQCKRIERLTLTGCKQLTDQGVISFIEDNKSLLALDVTGVEQVSDVTLLKVAEHCVRLQGLNLTDCPNITDDSLVPLSKSCRGLKRLKLNNCHRITDDAIISLANNCPSMLELDLQNCRHMTDPSITALLSLGRHLRELRLAHCNLVTDYAFLDLRKNITFENLRILDLTACHQLHDAAVEKIIDASPRMRNLVLAKCREITDRSVFAITKLGKNLHYIHLGHCAQITDTAVISLVKLCNRIRYIDLACCQRLTDTSVKHLATLPKLRRIGLVKCQSITDASILALAKVYLESRAYLESRPFSEPRSMRYGAHSLLERVHLSYCINLTLQGIHALLNRCPKLTHLSLTGVQAFYDREDLITFCREAPSEFTEHQREVFCVFSGEGVNRLRNYLNIDQSALHNGTMYVDEDGEDQQVAGLMNATAINDDDDMDDDSQDGVEVDS